MATETVQIVVDSLRAAGVRYVFGVPGAKIDSVFNALVDHPEIKLVVCRHEQNAAFIAAAMGKITGLPGVCIATSGPGTSNLVTGLVTATDEGAPMVAIVGSVKRSQALKKTHQSLRGVELLTPVTKKAAAAVVEDQVAEIMLDAFRVAAASPRGATVVSLPIDIMTTGRSMSAIPAFPPSAFLPPAYGPAPAASLDQAAALIRAAKAPVLFLGMRAANPAAVEAVHAFLHRHPMPVIETFQAAGAIPTELVHLFYGRIGLFRNQPGDKLLTHADLVITVGYDQSEYDANLWNGSTSFDIIHVDTVAADYNYYYGPKLELLGSLADNVDALAGRLDGASVARLQDAAAVQSIFADFHAWESKPEAQARPEGGPVHPPPLHPPAAEQDQPVHHGHLGRGQRLYLALPLLLLVQAQDVPHVQRPADARRSPSLGHRRLLLPAARAVRRKGRQHQRRRWLPLQRPGARHGRAAGLQHHAFHLGRRQVQHG